MIEADGTYVSSRRAGIRGRGPESKTIVFGMLQRKGNISAKVVPNTKRKFLKPLNTNNGEKGRYSPTGESATYNVLRESSYKHGAVQHSLTIYVDVIHHVNDIEGVWN